jgi:hypothetical protein
VNLPTIPFIDMFSGIGSASHYLKQWCHPVAAFDSDADAENVFTSHFPGVPMAGDFDNITNGPDGPGTYKQRGGSAGTCGFRTPTVFGHIGDQRQPKRIIKTGTANCTHCTVAERGQH